MLKRIMLAAILLPGAVSAAGLEVPSGRAVEALDVVTDAPGVGTVYRFRFLAPGLDPAADPEAVAADMGYLCETVALPSLPSLGETPDEIVITLLAEPVEFGASRPDVVQLFELYEPRDGACVWKPY